VLTPPVDLPLGTLTEALAAGWGIDVRTLDYRPVGWGSHHWTCADHDGSQWFVTVDDLVGRRQLADEPLDDAAARLEAALSAAHALGETGHRFVVAPVPTVNGPIIRRVTGFAVAVYPHVTGDSFGFGHRPDTDHAAAMLDMVTAVHAAPARVRDLAPVDDFAIPHRDHVEAALDGAAVDSAAGPYALETARLVARHAPEIRAALDRYDELVSAALSARGRAAVLTHGEPHPGNTMRTDAGWVLIDWDTALVAPPERDLWSLDPGDGSAHAAYTAGTGAELRPGLLELYRRRWDLADVAVDVARFRRRHVGSAEDSQSFEILGAQVAGLAGLDDR